MERMGVISAAVPEKKTSSAMYSISAGRWSQPAECEIAGQRQDGIARDSGSTEAPSGGVWILPSRTTKMFSPELR